MDFTRAFELLSSPVWTCLGQRAAGVIEMDFKSFSIPNQSNSTLQGSLGRYNLIYKDRLNATRAILEQKVKEKWPGTRIKNVVQLCIYSRLPEVKKVSLFTGLASTKDSSSNSRVVCFNEKIKVVLIGTVIKNQRNKPSILNTVQGSYSTVPQRGPNEKWTSEDDYLVLEDDTGHVRLSLMKNCGINIGQAVNGIVIAIQGTSSSDGTFIVKDVFYATPRPCQWPTVLSSQTEMVFISGLGFGKAGAEHHNRIEILFEHLSGICGSPMEQKEILFHRNRIFFVGNLFDSDVVIDAKQTHALDLMLSELAQNVDVYVLPGIHDPAHAIFPQPAMHPLVFPISSKLSTFHSLTNPSRFTATIESMDGTLQKLDVLVTSGQNIDDGLRNSTETDPLKMSVNTLKWGHICPTSPDTMPLNTNGMTDVLVLDSLPNIYVVGNQTDFDQVGYLNTRIVNLPVFATTGMAVIFDKDMCMTPLHFNVCL